jgi:hypothetical protein
LKAPTAEDHIGRLLRMFAGIEETIIYLEARGGGGDSDRLIRRLRMIQDEIASALRLLDDRGGGEGRPEPPLSGLTPPAER